MLNLNLFTIDITIDCELPGYRVVVFSSASMCFVCWDEAPSIYPTRNTFVVELQIMMVAVGGGDSWTIL